MEDLAFNGSSENPNQDSDPEDRTVSIPFYSGDRDRDEGDIEVRFNFRKGIERTGGTERIEKSSLLKLDNIVSFNLDEKQEKVADGKDLKDTEVDMLMSYARAGYEEEAFEVLKSHYELVNKSKIDQEDALNLLTIKSYAETQSRDDWVQDIDSIIRPRLNEVSLPTEITEAIREHYLDEDISYTAVRSGLKQIEELPDDHAYWDQFDEDELEWEIEEEKWRYLKVAEPKISIDRSYEAVQDPPIVASGSGGGIGKIVYQAVRDAISKVPLATTSDIRQLEDEIDDCIEKEIEDLSEELEEDIDELDSNLNETEELVREIKDDLTGTRRELNENINNAKEEVNEKITFVREDIAGLDSEVGSLSDNQEDILGEIKRLNNRIDHTKDDLKSEMAEISKVVHRIEGQINGGESET